MSRAVRVLCQPATAAGFRLAGLVPAEAADAEAGVRRLQRLLDDPGAGIVLVEDEFYRAVPPAMRRAMARRALPMVVPFPSVAWAAQGGGAEGFIAELLRQAIGYRVRLG